MVLNWDLGNEFTVFARGDNLGQKINYFFGTKYSFFKLSMVLVLDIGSPGWPSSP